MRLIPTGWMLALLLLAAPALAQESEAPDIAAPELTQGYWHVNIERGYDEFALPVANWALGRDWALRSSLPGNRRLAPLGPFSWQIGHNYSTVPIRVDFLHRQPQAFRGRIEVISAHGFASEEAAQGSLTLLSREVLVPPSQPKSYMLLPRVSPPSNPGEVVRLEVRIYASGQSQPMWSDNVFATQLEPAWIYSLRLDGAMGELPSRDALNQDNHLQLELISNEQSAAEALSSLHFVLNVDRRQVTMAPLACRDFAFVTASLPEVRAWPEAEQVALTQFMLGGGYLCLYDAEGADWQGLPLAEPGPVGRGWLLPVAGDFDAARGAMQAWLEGELEEFTLWAGGTVAGDASLAAAEIGALATDGLRCAAMLIADQRAMAAEAAPRHVAGYMNPIWIYREACRIQATEPWDGREFIRAAQSVQASAPSYFVQQARGVSPSVHRFLTSSRSLPPAHWFLAGLVLVAICLCGTRVCRRWYIALGLGLVIALGGVAWWRTEPYVPVPVELSIRDADVRLTAQVSRSLLATTPGPSHTQELAIDESALLRAVHWDNPQGWEWQITLEDSTWRGTGEGGYLALSLDTPVAAPEPLPVQISGERQANGNTRLHFDTSGLPPGQVAWLLTPLGWSVIPPAVQDLSLEIAWPDIPAQPGAERMAALGRVVRAWHLDIIGPNGIRQDTRRLKSSLEKTNTADELPLLAWKGLTDVPGGLRGLLAAQALLFVPVLTDESSSELTSVAYLRIAIPLGQDFAQATPGGGL